MPGFSLESAKCSVTSVIPNNIVKSFRDPRGQLEIRSDGAWRWLTEEGYADLITTLNAPSVQNLVARGYILPTELDNSPVPKEIVGRFVRAARHPLVDFPTFPYEWTAGMLLEAGRLTLDIAGKILDDNLQLKDASPYNILFNGPKPVFVDLLSIEPHDPHVFTWLPFAQFLRSFVLPLALHRFAGASLQELFLAHRDGITPELVWPRLGIAGRLKNPFLFHVTLPILFRPKKQIIGKPLYQCLTDPDQRKARYIFCSLFRRLRKDLESAVPSRRSTSHWTGYAEIWNYSIEAQQVKMAFVKRFASPDIKWALDIGCNTGDFSIAVAQASGGGVVALDSDEASVETVRRRAIEKNIRLVPIVSDLTRPSPATGWRNKESPSLLDRLAGRFDLVLMLAVLHHLLIMERIPLDEILKLAFSLTRRLVLIEYIPPDDSMFQTLCRGRDALFTYFTEDYFTGQVGKKFNILERIPLPQSKRILYALKKP